MTSYIDRHDDVWTDGHADGLLHSHETAPFSREYVERKWGPLRAIEEVAEVAEVADTVERVDKYHLRVSGVMVVGNDRQERIIRDLTPDQRARFAQIMGGRAR